MKALKITVAVLVAVSVGRWLLAPPAQVVDAGEAVALGELLDSSHAELTEAQARAKPLAEGERIDPNRATAVELDRLSGVGPATAKNIVEEREANGPFLTADDLTRVRGIGPTTVAKIEPFLDLDDVPPPSANRRVAGGRSTGREGTLVGGRPDVPGRPPGGANPVDVNRASAQELQRLPGIGPALAKRIVAARREGPFTSLDDLLRVSGIGPQKLGRLRPFATVGGA